MSEPIAERDATCTAGPGRPGPAPPRRRRRGSAPGMTRSPEQGKGDGPQPSPPPVKTRTSAGAINPCNNKARMGTTNYLRGARASLRTAKFHYVKDRNSCKGDVGCGDNPGEERVQDPGRLRDPVERQDLAQGAQAFRGVDDQGWQEIRGRPEVVDPYHPLWPGTDESASSPPIRLTTPHEPAHGLEKLQQWLLPRCHATGRVVEGITPPAARRPMTGGGGGGGVGWGRGATSGRTGPDRVLTTLLALVCALRALGSLFCLLRPAVGVPVPGEGISRS